MPSAVKFEEQKAQKGPDLAGTGMLRCCGALVAASGGPGQQSIHQSGEGAGGVSLAQP